MHCGLIVKLSWFSTICVYNFDIFVGNVILKLYEGVGAVLIKKVKAGMMTTLRSKIGALLVKPALKTTLKDINEIINDIINNQNTSSQIQPFFLL